MPLVLRELQDGTVGFHNSLPTLAAAQLGGLVPIAVSCCTQVLGTLGTSLRYLMQCQHGF
jgi:hypothetical protein